MTASRVLPKNNRKNTSPQKEVRSVYPFSAIVGQEDMKLALLLNALDSHIGGVVIMGHRGTGKSTAVRALADLLPSKNRVRGCLFNCDPDQERELCDNCKMDLQKGLTLEREPFQVPVVELPLGATEDRVCGSLDLEKALTQQIKVFEPGLLARAHRGFLYIDEVNLLEDFLVDLLLDAAASGWNQVEREGISVNHPANFVLVGSGNPEEGELRPQLLDRFGLFVRVTTVSNLDDRVKIVGNRDHFERDPYSFFSKMNSAQKDLQKKLKRAFKRVTSVKVDQEVIRKIAELCVRLQVDGHRGELTISRAARALAAWKGHESVNESDVRRVTVMSLQHRLRKDPLEQFESSDQIKKILDQVFPLVTK